LFFGSLLLIWPRLLKVPFFFFFFWGFWGGGGGEYELPILFLLQLGKTIYVLSLDLINREFVLIFLNIERYY